MENSVDWQNDCFYFTSQIKFLFEKEKFLDCSFLVGLEPNQKKLSAHKLILAIKSPVFERSFYGSIPFEDDPIIVLDLSADAFDAMIKFMYTEKVNFKSVEEACHVWAAAKKYMVYLLEELCLQYVWNNISRENALIVYNWAYLFENELFKQKCFTYRQLYMEYFFEHPESLDIHPQVFLELFQEKNPVIYDELKLFTFLENFSKKHELFTRQYPENLQTMAEIDSHKTEVESVVREAVKQIPFLTLTENEFTKATHDSKILTVFEKNAILSNILKTNKVPEDMPKGFSTSRCKRNIYYTKYPDTKKKLYFHWLARPNQIKPSHLQEPCITFQVNRSIWIVGVELNSSEESFAYIRLINKSRVQLSFGCNSTEKKSSSELLYFENPVFIQPSESYSLMSGAGGVFGGKGQITFYNGRTHTNFNYNYFDSPISHGPEVKFMFTNISESFLSKLIFHYPYSKDYKLIFKDADFSD